MNLSLAAYRPAFVGIDDGHCAVKLVTEDGRMLSVPSRLAPGTDGAVYTTDDGLTLTVDGCGAAAAGLSGSDVPLRGPDVTLAPHSPVLVHHALRQAGFGGRRVRIATGLPLDGYYRDHAPDAALIGAKIDSLRRPMRSDAGACAEIVANVVTSAAVAAYFDQIMDMDGNPTPACEDARAGRVGVIDVGAGGTNCAIILPGGTRLDTGRSGSAGIGAGGLHERVDAALCARFGFDEVPPALVDGAIDTGVIRVHGEDQGVHELVLAEKEALADAIMQAVRARIGTGKDLAWVLFCGGGAVPLRAQLARRYPHCRFPDHPRFAGARGMLKIAKYVFGPKD